MTDDDRTDAPSNTPQTRHQRRWLGLRGKHLSMVGGLYLLIGAVALTALITVGGDLVNRLGASWAEQYVKGHKQQVLAAVSPNVALSRMVARAPAMRAWAREPDGAGRKAAAEAELRNFRRLVDSGTVFVALEADSALYYQDTDGEEVTWPKVENLNPDDSDDSWYFTTTEGDGRFNLNVDHNADLDTTKLWINVPIPGAEGPLGALGTGIDLSRFIQTFVQPDQRGVSAMLLDAAGRFRAHRDPEMIAFNAASKTPDDRAGIWSIVDTQAAREELRDAMAGLKADERETAVLEVPIRGEDRMLALAYLAPLDWFSVVSLDTTAVIGAEAFTILPAVLVGSLLVTLAVVAVLDNRVVLQPLWRLADGARAMAGGDLTVRLHRPRNDEIGDLTHAFDTMANTVADHVERLETRVAERTRELETANNSLTEANRAIYDSLAVAQTIQRAHLPDLERLTPHMAEVFVIWTPRDQVGGDLYLARADESGLMWGVMDCTGHGVPGACMAMAAHAAFTDAVDHDGLRQPEALLERIDQRIRQRLARTATQSISDYGLDMGICRWAYGDTHLQFAGANIRLLYADAKGCDWVPATRRSLGYRTERRSSDFTTEQVAVTPGRAFYMSSDGFIEQPGGPKGIGFGRRRFRRFVADVWDRPMPHQRDAFADAFADWRGGEAQRDDVTVLAVRPKPLDGNDDDPATPADPAGSGAA